MSEKDFLSQFSSDGKKPDSFKEEERVKVEKPKKNIDPKIFIIIGVVLVALGVLAYFLFFAPKIEMPNFVGQTKDDVSAWVKQQEISTTGIIFKEEYNFDNDEDVILSQDVEPGKKVKNNVKITFGISLGADPDEKVSLPDIKSMTKTDLEDWISSNKLTKTKITTSYNDTVKEGEVISYEVKGVDEDDFTRSSTLNISVSKGPQPAGTVTVSDFKDKSKSEVESWIKTNKLTNATITEAFSNTVESGLVISQSVAANKTIKTGDAITFTISKGKGIKVPDLSKMNETEIKDWCSKNGITSCTIHTKYSNSDSKVLSSNVSSGSTIASSDDVEITVNGGKYFYASDEELTEYAKVGANVLKLEDWCNQMRNEDKGIDAYVGDWSGSAEVYSEVYSKGQIVSIEISSYSSGQKYNISDRLPLDVRFSVVVSKGKYYRGLFASKEGTEATVADVMKMLSSKGIIYTLAGDVTDYNGYAKIKDYDASMDLYDDVSYVIENASKDEALRVGSTSSSNNNE